MFEHLEGNIKMLVGNQFADRAAEKLVQSETTFKFIRKFLKVHARSLSVVVPVKWYEMPPK